MRVFLISFLCMISMLHACKEEKSQPVTEAKNVIQDTVMQQTAEKKAMGAGQIEQLHKQASAILAYRLENKPEKYAIIDVGVWEYEAAFKEGAMSKPGEYAGHWIDFDEKGGYEFGVYDEVKGKGKYHYDNDSHLLLLVNNDPQVKPEEYELKLIQSVMIMMGKSTYQDNGFQAKLLKTEKRPAKK